MRLCINYVTQLNLARILKATRAVPGVLDFMTVTVTRSGGLLGAPMTYRVDAQSLDSTQARQLEAMLESLPQGGNAPPSGADFFQYDIEAAQGGMTRQWRFYGDPNPGAPLIEFVKQHS